MLQPSIPLPPPPLFAGSELPRRKRDRPKHVDQVTLDVKQCARGRELYGSINHSPIPCKRRTELIAVAEECGEKRRKCIGAHIPSGASVAFSAGSGRDGNEMDDGRLGSGAGRERATRELDTASGGFCRGVEKVDRWAGLQCRGNGGIRNTEQCQCRVSLIVEW